MPRAIRILERVMSRRFGRSRSNYSGGEGNATRCNRTAELYQPRRVSDSALPLGFAGPFQVARPVAGLEPFLRQRDRPMRLYDGSLQHLNRLAAVLNRFQREAYRFHRFVIRSKGHEFLWPTAREEPTRKAGSSISLAKRIMSRFVQVFPRADICRASNALRSPAFPCCRRTSPAGFQACPAPQAAGSTCACPSGTVHDDHPSADRTHRLR